jgi:hypothetical protein
MIAATDNLTAEATSAAGAAVTYPRLHATDAVDGTDPVTCTPEAGATFPLGSTTVHCTAIDQAGNTGRSTFSVTIVDTTPPALTLPGRVTADATSPAGTTVTFAANAEDIVDGAVSPNCAPQPGTDFTVGDTTVTCSATDAAGNTATGSFVVHVAGPAEQLSNLQAAAATMPQSKPSLAQLDAVARSFAAAHTQAAVAQLQGFRSRVQAGAGTIYSPEQAAHLTTAANTLIRGLGG